MYNLKNGYAGRLNYDDVFTKRIFNSYIYKEENVYDRSISEYATGVDALLESEKAKNTLFEFRRRTLGVLTCSSPDRGSKPCQGLKIRSAVGRPFFLPLREHLMVTPFLDTAIEYLKGVGPARAEILKKELQIFTFGELVAFFPFRYVDRSKFISISEIGEDSIYVQIRARMTRITEAGAPRAKGLLRLLRTGPERWTWCGSHGQKWVLREAEAGAGVCDLRTADPFRGRWNIGPSRA